MKKIVAVLSLLFLLSCVSMAQAKDVKYSASINGHDWNATAHTEKLAFIEGINYAIAIDYEIDKWRQQNNMSSIISVFDKAWAEKFSGHTTSQIVDEIDNFYTENPDKLNLSLGRVLWYEILNPKQ